MLFGVVYLLSTLITIRADEISDLLGQAKDAYEKKNYPQSTQLIHKALGGIRKIISSQIMEFLPDEIEGWSRSAPTSSLDTGESIGVISSQNYSVEVKYSDSKQNQQVSVTISNIAHIVQIAKAGLELYKNPYFQKMQKERQTDEKIETLNVQGFEGAKTTHTKSKRHEIVLFYQDLMIQIRGTGMEDPTRLDVFTNAVNFEGLKDFSKEITQNEEKPADKPEV